MVIESSLPGVQEYEIPLTAIPHDVQIIINDPSPLFFGRIRIGESSKILRSFTNRGGIATDYHIVSDNEGLTVYIYYLFHLDTSK